MKKRGFTLIELLAVIVVIAVVAIIAVPIILGIIETAEKGSLKNSAYGLISAAENYYAINSNKMDSSVKFIIENGEIISEDKLHYKGNVKTGTIILNTKAEVLICIDNGKNYALKYEDDTEVVIGDGTCGEYSEENGSFEIINATAKKIEELENKITDLETNVLSLETEISNGKSLIANAITDRGLQTNPTLSFEELGNNIQNISSGSLFYAEKQKDKKTTIVPTGYYNSSDLYVNQLDITVDGTTSTVTYATDGTNYTFSLEETYIISDTVIAIVYKRNYDYTYTANTACGFDDYYYKTNTYVKTFLYSSGAWSAVATVNINPTFYNNDYYKYTCNSSGDYTNYTNYYISSYIYEMPWQDISYNNAYFFVEEYRYYDYTSWTDDNATFYQDTYIPNTLVINKSTGAMTLSTSTTAYTNRFYPYKGTYNATTYYYSTSSGYAISTYKDNTLSELSKTVYYNYVGTTVKTFTVTGGTLAYELEGFSSGAYQGLSNLKYYIVPSSLTLDANSKTLTLAYNYANIPTLGYPTANTVINNVKISYDISNILPDGKKATSTKLSHYSNWDSFIGSRSATKDMLMYNNGKYYAIMKLNEGYLYIIGELTEDNDVFPSKLNLNITSVRYSPTLYDGSDAITTLNYNNYSNLKYMFSTGYNQYEYKLSLSK